MSTIDECRVTIDGTVTEAVDGQNLAAVMVAHGVWHFRTHMVTGETRGPYCGMGICFECEVEVDGRPGVRACITDVREGMIIRTVSDQDVHRYG